MQSNLGSRMTEDEVMTLHINVDHTMTPTVFGGCTLFFILVCNLIKLEHAILCFQNIQDSLSLEDLEELNSNARRTLQQLKQKIEELERLGKEQDRDEDRQNILKNVDNHRQRMTNNVAALRKTNLTVKIAIDKREKDELLSGGARTRHRNKKETLAKAASNITESLIELNQTLDAQVRKGNLTLTTLESSSKSIGETHEEFKSMGGHIENSKRLLTKYGQRELTDKVFIFIALVFFFTTVAYILKRRLFD